jgi:hypothetical protein
MDKYLYIHPKLTTMQTTYNKQPETDYTILLLAALLIWALLWSM